MAIGADVRAIRTQPLAINVSAVSVGTDAKGFCLISLGYNADHWLE
jgi:hypothetical protein